jgi:Flp pilus assembly protein TadG
MLRKSLSALRSMVRRYGISNHGNVAMMFGLTLFPLLVATGGVVDFTRYFRAQTDMQDAIDATALALSRQPNIGSMSTAEMQAFATDYFKGNFSNPETEELTVTASYSSKGPTVKLDAAGTLPTTLLGLIHLDELPLAASAKTVWGQQRLRVALVLDNTGSMAQDNKMAALKAASHSLLGQLEVAASKKGDVYVSIIPFSKDVNADASNFGESWVKWDLWDEVNGICSVSKYTTSSSCVGAKNAWTVNDHKTWNGCVTDRDQDYDTTNVEPAAGTAGTLFPAEQYGSCSSPLMGLTYDWTALNDAIDAMQPSGNTNQAIGLQWGWQSLTSSPFTVPALDPAHEYKQIIILLTDGLNTEDRWDKVQSNIDARQKIACDNIKATGVEVFAVQVNTGKDPTSMLLENCASNPSNFFLLKSADEIVTTFEQIGTEIAELRLSS